MKRFKNTSLLGLLAIVAIIGALFTLRAFADNNRELWDYFAEIVNPRTGPFGLFEPNSAMNVRLSSATISLSTVPGDSNRNYVYKSSDVASPANITLTGTGASWAVSASTGPVTFNLNGGDSITLSPGQSLGSNFKDKIVNPSVHVTALGAGAVAKVFIDGGL